MRAWVISGTPRSGMASVGYIQLLREQRDYRHMWAGEVISFIGDWFNTVALYTAVQELSDSAQAVALVLVAKTLPPIFVSPLSGPLVDSMERRRLLILTDFARAACALTLIASLRAHSLVGLYAGTVLLTAFGAIAFPAKQAVLPMIVPVERLVAANALGGGTWSAMLAVGAALGGAATQALGMEAAFAIDAATFLISAAFFSRLPTLPPPDQHAHAPRGFVQGLRYLRRSPRIMALAALKPLFGLLGGVMVLVPIFGSGVFRSTAGPVYVGLLFAVRGLGALVGSLGIHPFLSGSARSLRRALVPAFAITSASFLYLATADNITETAMCFFCGAVGTAMIWVFSGALLQMEADRAYHGRVFSVEFGLFTLLMSASSYAAGLAMDLGYTAWDVAAVGGLWSGVAAAIWLLLVLLFERSDSARAQRTSGL